MPIHKHPDLDDKGPSVTQRLFAAAQRKEAPPTTAPQGNAAVESAAAHGGAGGGEASAVHKALRQWQESGEPGTDREPPEAQASMQGGASLSMKPLSVPTGQLNKLAQAEVEQHGAVPVQLLGEGGQPIAASVAAGTQDPTAATGSQTGGVNWSQGELPPDYQQNLESYGIQTVVGPDGRITVTSNNIRVEVQSLGAEFDAMFAGKSEEEINQLLEQWRGRKDADDALGYGSLTNADGSGQVQGTGDLRDLARQSGYYGSEQHVVWATAASARTGGRIPPEFFLELDPFGGTAGNGPEIIANGTLQGGGAGGLLSTIAMGHDTDWTLGRLMGVGPLQELHDLNPQNELQMKLMGPVGLMNSNAAYLSALSALPAELQAEVQQASGGLLGFINGPAKQLEILDRLRSDPRYAPFFAAIDTNYQFGGDVYSFGRSDWTVQYTPQYIAEQTHTSRTITDRLPYTWSGQDCPTRRRDDLADLTAQHAPGYRPPDDEHESD